MSQKFPFKSEPKSTTWDEIELLFIGAGTMGASLAQAYSQNGFNVGVLDVSDEILQNASNTIDAELNAAKGRIFSPQQIFDIKGRILFTTSYEEACKGKNLQLVVETATEKIDVKKKIFKTLDKLCAPHVVFATNSSSLNTNILADVTNRSDKVVWMHYFYLPHRNRGGEVAGTDTASDESIQKAMYYMKLGGKMPTLIKDSRKGGVADIIFVALLHEATRLLQEGYDIPTIEQGGMEAFNIPMGFLALMDNTGLPVGLFSMYSFSDSSDPDDPLYQRYGNFYEPMENYIELMKLYDTATDKSKIKWIPPEEQSKKPDNPKKVTEVKERFQAVGFMTAIETVDAGLIGMEELDQLCQNAFVWREGAFTLMNKLGIKEVYRVIKERVELAAKQGTTFPIPDLLVQQGEKGENWPLKPQVVFHEKVKDGKISWITFAKPQAANAMDDFVFESFKQEFDAANADPDTEVIIFDTAPIKTFIAGANVPNFIDNIKKGNFEGIKESTRMWQQVMFHSMTGTGKPKVAIVDGMTLGGGVEVAMCLAYDPDTTVIITERTSFSLPEARLGIFPGLRGTLLLPQLIHKATGDKELAIAMARYYTLAGGTATSSPRLIKSFGMADLLIPSNKRDEVALQVAGAISENNGKSLSKEQLSSLNIEELPDKLTLDEQEEIRIMKDLFLRPNLIPNLYAYGLGWAQPYMTADHMPHYVRIARRVANCSPNAVWTANWLINKGFDDYLKGVDLETLAERELDEYLVPIFKHHEALIGLEAMVKGDFPDFWRTYPL